MGRNNWWLRSVAALALIAYLVFAPEPLLAALSQRPYYDWLAGAREAQSGVVTLWHVVDFKPYQGSVTAYLESVAAAYEKEHPGVYVEIIGMDEARLAERLERGERPDVWSFSKRKGVPEALAPLELPPQSYGGELRPLEQDGAVVAVPYCCSGYFLLGNAVLLQQRKLVWPTGEPEPAILEQAGQADEGDFKAGQAPVCIGDARLAGDITRKAAREGFTLLTLPLGPETDQVQYLAVHEEAEAFQRRHGQALIHRVMTQESQSKLTALGLIPAVDGLPELQYADSQMQALYASYRAPRETMPNEQEKAGE